ncbi:gamma-butyrobetaine hydroxylase-like domain-containing protein [Ancylobacter sp. IITR112]|uniref:gamma-butyrobetaine hydroxylase-like domain-containing protein n=1 Tax=Ancylobacter sp. IITR112 TaxID=3138073 RepID=UPI00352A86D1
MTDAVHWPTEIKVHKDRRVLTIAFEGGASYALPAELLRVESPSAEVQGHSPADRQLVAGKREVRITEAIPVGNYAVRLIFDDGHSTGIYTWDWLYELGRDQEARYKRYLQELAAKNLSRDAPGTVRRH